MILLIDNYDSFVHNLARYFERLGQETLVVRNDVVDALSVRRLQPQAIVLSPGPCTPNEAGCSIEVVQELHSKIPLLGVCLGHQAIAAAFGASIVRAAEPRHGRTSCVQHNGAALFAGIPSPFSVCRYHSLVVAPETLPSALAATAHADDGAIMALAHTDYPVIGVQFHPEAALTECGYQLLANFLAIAGLSVNVNLESLTATENREPPEAPFPAPALPLTF